MLFLSKDGKLNSLLFLKPLSDFLLEFFLDLVTFLLLQIVFDLNKGLLIFLLILALLKALEY